MRRLPSLFISAAVIGCSTPTPPIQDLVELNVVNGSVLADDLRVYVDEVERGMACYPCSSGLALSPGRHLVRLTSSSGRGTGLSVTVDLARVRTELIAVDSGGSVRSLIVPNENSQSGPGVTRFHLIHASAISGPVDLYVTPTGADLATATATATGLTYGSVFYGDVDPDLLQVQVTAAGSRVGFGRPAFLDPYRTLILTGDPPFIFPLP